MAKKMNPLWGAAIGTGAGTLTAVGIRQFVKNPTMVKYSEGIGFLAGALPGVAMMMLGKGKYKDAGVAAIVAALANNGVRQAEQLMLTAGTPKAAETAGIAGTVIDPTTVLQGQLGLTELTPASALLGAYQEGQRDDLPQLVGANLAAANSHIQGMGGPALSAYASHWGSTHFSH